MGKTIIGDDGKGRCRWCGAAPEFLSYQQSLKKSILSHHTSAEDAGRVAREAGVKMLVLSHLVPADDPEVTPQMWIDGARRNFTGEIVVGRDPMEL